MLRALDRGDRPTEIARRFEVSRVWVYQVRGQEQETGARTSLPIGGHRRSRLAGLELALRAWIAAQPDLTLAELQQRLAQQGISIKLGALWHQLNKWSLTFKKTLHASEQERADVPSQCYSTFMTVEQFRESLCRDDPPAGLDFALAGLWWDAKGDWTKAHESAQQDEGPAGSWVHAYLHRKEGDASNARYWITSTARSMPASELIIKW
jgi:transposase